MQNKQKEKIIRTYFNMWVERDFNGLKDIFDSEIYYSECYGPEYRGLAEIELWIEEMLKKQKVLEWTIKQFIHQDKTTVAEWFFKDETAGKTGQFDGTSIIEFQDDMKIKSIKEFSSVSTHIRPFDNVKKY